jgi:phytoene dehydrogenase-like protein
MPNKVSYDAVVVGAGPNGLAAAIRLAQAGWSVLVVEASDTIGGAARSAELTLPGFVHDVCSAVYPLGVGSPFFRQLPLEGHGLKWIEPELLLAHPLGDGGAVALCRSLAQTAQGLGEDGAAYERLLSPLLADWEGLAAELLRPLPRVPRRPLALARFGLLGLRSASGLARSRFAAPPARALFAGLAAHSCLPLEQRGSAAFGLVLALAGHAVGWPLPRGGAQQLAEALAAHLRVLGGEIATRYCVEKIDQLPLARAVLLDVTPRQALRLAGHKLPVSYRARLERFRYGPGVFKVDYAMDWPIPWRAAACGRASTVHLGGTLGEIAATQRDVAEGRLPERPFVILVQPSLFDPTRAPEGCHTVWAYCHVPNGSTYDMTERIENQIERFAPGFRPRVLARHTMNCADLERHNPNLVGGDISGGAAELRQLWARPVLSPAPYRTPVPGLYLCSASTPPGGGVHGMCGFHAAETVLRDLA